MLRANISRQIFWPLAAALAAVCPAAAFAAPGHTMQITGSADATVVDPLQIEPIDDLRFGRLASPATAGTVSITAAGAITSTLDLAQFTSDRGPASFILRGDANRRFILFLPNSTSITNGTATMQVDRIRSNTGIFGLQRFDGAGEYDLNVGGRLNVNANQQVGSYSGTFDVTVLYL